MGGRPRAIDRELAPTSPRRFEAVVPAKPRDIWRAALRQAVGADGRRLWTVLLDIAEGKAWIPKLPDGREGPPQVPTTKDRASAATFLAEALFGRAVDQTLVVEAEKAASENAALSAMSDSELLLEARRVIGGLPADGSEVAPTEEDAEEVEP